MSTYALPPSDTRWAAFWMHGRDAQDYLQRMTSAAAGALTVGSGTPATLLNPQGRVQAFFYIWRTGPETFLLETESGASSGDAALDLKTALETFHFAEDFTLTDLPADWAPVWIFTAAEQADFACSITEHGIEPEIAGPISLHRSSQEFGKPWTAVWGTPTQIKSARNGLSLESAQALEYSRILSLHPRVGHEITSESNPLEIGMKAAVADNKGCYPGQEVLEKILSLGAPARRLALLKVTGSEPPTVGTPLVDAGGPELGKLTSVASGSEGIHALAIVRKTAAAPGREFALPDGARAQLLKLAPYRSVEDESE